MILSSSQLKCIYKAHKTTHVNQRALRNIKWIKNMREWKVKYMFVGAKHIVSIKPQKRRWAIQTVSYANCEPCFKRISGGSRFDSEGNAVPPVSVQNTFLTLAILWIFSVAANPDMIFWGLFNISFNSPNFCWNKCIYYGSYLFLNHCCFDAIKIFFY